MEEIFDCIDVDTIFSGLDTLLEIYEDTAPRIIKRKYRKGKKRYFGRPILVYNPIHDMLGFNLRMTTSLLKNILKSEQIR